MMQVTSGSHLTPFVEIAHSDYGLRKPSHLKVYSLLKFGSFLSGRASARPQQVCPLVEPGLAVKFSESPAYKALSSHRLSHHDNSCSAEVSFRIGDNLGAAAGGALWHGEPGSRWLQCRRRRMHISSFNLI